MTPTQFFCAALDRAPSVRQQFLDSHCPPDLRPAVDSLLSAHEHASQALGAHPFSCKQLLDAPEPTWLANELAHPGSVLRDPQSGAERWEIHDVLPSSSLAVVYLGVDLVNSVPFVAKTYPRYCFANLPALRNMFENEATLWYQLPCHPHVLSPTLLELQGRHYILLPYCPMGDLGQLVGAPPLLGNLRLALLYGIQIASGIRHAHAHGIRAHRDIKPQNCLVLSQLLVAVTDFGISIGDGTKAAPPSGSPPYAPPEQWTGAECNVASDAYAFGATLYELVVGGPPFGRAGSGPEYDFRLAELRNKHAHAQPSWPADLPVALRGLIAKCLEKRPEDRFQSFADIEASLRAMFHDITGHAAPELSSHTAATEDHPLRRQAIAQYQLSNYDAALPLFRAYLQHNKDSDPSAWSAYCEAAFLAGYAQEAVEAGEVAVRIAPESDHAHIALANAHDANGNASKAEAHYLTARKTAKGGADAQLCYDMALFYDRHGRTKAARSLYEDALQLNPQNAMAWVNLGVMHKEAGDTQEAERHLRKAIECNPQLEEAWFNLGHLVEDKLKKTPGDALARTALDCFRKAAGCNSADPTNWSRLAAAASRVEEHRTAMFAHSVTIVVGPHTTLALRAKTSLEQSMVAVLADPIQNSSRYGCYFPELVEYLDSKTCALVVELLVSSLAKQVLALAKPVPTRAKRMMEELRKAADEGSKILPPHDGKAAQMRTQLSDAEMALK